MNARKCVHSQKTYTTQAFAKNQARSEEEEKEEKRQERQRPGS